MKKNVRSLLLTLYVAVMLIFSMNMNATATTENFEVSNKEDFLAKMNQAIDGDIIKLTSDIVLNAGNNGDGDCFVVPENCLVILDLNGKTIEIDDGSNSDNVGVGANSALLIKNGTFQTVDTKNSDTGVLILSNVTVTNRMFLGATQAWIVNDSNIDELLVELGQVNPGSSLNPIIIETSCSYNHENSAPAMVGSGVTWKCLSTLQEDFNQASTSGYNRIIMLKDYTLTDNSTLNAEGVNLNLGGYTLTTGSYTLSLTHNSGTNVVNSGKIDGNITMESGSGEVTLSNLDVTGDISNYAHPVAIQSGHYNNIIGGLGKVSISNGFYAGTLSGSNYEISGGYFVTNPNSNYIKSGYELVSTTKEEAGTTYYYKVVAHVHTWNYTADDATLTATCNAGDCSLTNTVESLTLTEASQVYTGSAISASVSDATDWTTTGLTVPTIQYQKKTGETTYAEATTTAPTDAGAYKASITADSATAYVEYSISKKPLTVTGTTLSNKVYDGNTNATISNVGTLVGMEAGDEVTLSANGIFANANIGTGKAVTVTYELLGADAGNYIAPVDNTGLTANIIAPYNEPVPTFTVPVEGDKSSVNVNATVSGTNATIRNVTRNEIETVGTGDTVVVNLTELNKNVTTVTIPRTTFENVASSEAAGLEVKLPNGITAVFDKTTLSAVAEQAKGSNIQLVVDKDAKAENTMTTAQKAAVETLNKPVVLDAYFISGGTRIPDFKGGEAELTTEYPTTYPVRVWYVKDDGTKELIPSTFDGKMAAFTVTHFSHYVIEMLEGSSYKSCPQDSTCFYAKFTDADTKAWYHDGVHFCVENGYMIGVTADKFAPSDTLSRGMIITMLWRMESSPVADYAMSFKDVADGKWYTEAIRWAQSTGVVIGYNNEAFGPNDNVTREQLAAILIRYAVYKGIDVSASADDIAKFSDAKSISTWALENVKWANAVGIINGRTEATIVPTDTATRAEAACMVQRFCDTILVK